MIIGLYMYFSFFVAMNIYQYLQVHYRIVYVDFKQLLHIALSMGTRGGNGEF